MLTNKLAGASGPSKTYIEDVFSTYLYTGNDTTNVINNGIDLAGKGGMVWLKTRGPQTNFVHTMWDTNRGIRRALSPNSTSAEAVQYNTFGLNSFNSNGFTLGPSQWQENWGGDNYASWTFRKAPKFFDVVTYTGNGASVQTLSHNLNITPGLVIIKAVSTTSDWTVLHNVGWLKLNTTGGVNAGGWNWSASTFEARNDSFVTNTNGVTYVAYLFAHDTSTDGLIQCGTVSDTGSGFSVDLGWEPQWVLFKRTNSTENWQVYDNMRGIYARSYSTGSGLTYRLAPNTADSESAISGPIEVLQTGFRGTMGPSWTGIYMAIRRGPMRTPTDGTTAFKPFYNYGAQNTRFTTGFPYDLSIWKDPASDFWRWDDRLRGLNTSSSAESFPTPTLYSNTADPEATNTVSVAYNVDNTGGKIGTYVSQPSTLFTFKRAPGFFDVVCYTGSGSGSYQGVNHNLGVTPELLIVKKRSATGSWAVGVLGVTGNSFLQTTNAFSSSTVGVLPGSSVGPSTTKQFVVTGNTTGASGGGYMVTNNMYVAYLFASCPGVSKVGTYTGNGSSQTINCGFTNGARFVLIKRTDSTGDWYVWDTARGIVAANDPHLSLNTTGANVTTDDTIDPGSTGFIVNQVAATNVNVSAATYIYLAIA